MTLNNVASEHQHTPEIIGKDLHGAVRKLNFDKGFGFIAGDDGRDYFFHWTGLMPGEKNFKGLVLQERITFDIVQSVKGFRAINLRCLRIE